MTRRIFCKVLLVVVAIFGLLVLSGVLSAQGRSEDAFDRVRDVQARNTDWLMAIDGVEGTAIGFNLNDRPVIKVFTAEPGVRGIPQELEGVPVQPVVTGKFYALSTTDRLPRPVPIGVSTGHPDITAGTIACRVRDLAGNVYALSNNHVYANLNEALPNDAVIQPGTFDGGLSPADDIGTLADFEEIKFDGSDNTIDAAIALSSTSLLGNATPSDGYGTPSSTTAAAVLRQRVKKYGRTTELTKGRIEATNATVDIWYDEEGVLVARFVNQIVISPGIFSAPGDSGSLIVTQGGNNPVGLLFAGSFFFTIANPIDAVLTRFGVTVDDSEEGPVDNPPVADFVGSPTSGDAPLTVSFTDLSSGAPTSWLWDFGDSVGTSTDQNPSYTYTLVGKYTVTLTATNAAGSDSETKTDYINVTEPGEGVNVGGISPNTMVSGTTEEDVTITGSGFALGADVTFENGSGPAPTASVTSVSDTEITATVTAKSGGPPRNRVWDVRVTNPDGSSGVLAGGFTVEP